MKNKNKHYDIARIVANADALNHSEIFECFYYGECDDMDGFNQIMDEISELEKMLPNGVNILDLPETILGNKKTKVFGNATCPCTEGHQILIQNYRNTAFFKDADDALQSGYRPCAKCMPEEYKKWKKKLQ